MRLTEHPAKFDPADRLKDGKSMTIVLSAINWFQIEKALERRVSPTEIRELIMGVFCGKYKIVKR